ncbi:unnamed protein product, partial [Prorocentrum cordatum]
PRNGADVPAKRLPRRARPLRPRHLRPGKRHEGGGPVREPQACCRAPRRKLLRVPAGGSPREALPAARAA